MGRIPCHFTQSSKASFVSSPPSSPRGHYTKRRLCTKALFISAFLQVQYSALRARMSFHWRSNFLGPIRVTPENWIDSSLPQAPPLTLPGFIIRFLSIHPSFFTPPHHHTCHSLNLCCCCERLLGVCSICHPHLCLYAVPGLSLI